jgi:pyroglutamyl-peptidase
MGEGAMLLLVLFSTFAFARETVLITAFEPFGGRKLNNSALVAAELAANFGKDWDYHVCVLPVEYDRAAENAKKCFAAMNKKPALVLSTGEGDCTVRAEIRAHNLDDTPGFPDNGGLIRENYVIEPSAPAHQPLTLPVPEMVCAARAEAKPLVRASISPGYFVCNATAFRLARFFSPQNIRFGFVHLPVAGDCGSSPRQSAEALHKMVGQVLAPRKSDPAFNACVVGVKKELDELLKKDRSAARRRGDVAPAAGR